MADPLSVCAELARQLYAGVIETPPWKSFLEELRKKTDSRNATIILSPPGSSAVNLLTTAGEPKLDNAYRDELFKMDRFVTLPEGLVTTLHNFFGEHELERDDYYVQILRNRWGTGFVLGGDVRTTAGYIARLRLARGIHANDFAAEEHQLVEALLPHLRQAVEIFDRVHCLQVEEVELSDALDRLGVASFLVDAKQRVSRPNRTAEALFAAGDGLSIRHERLVLTSEDAQRKFAEILAQVRNSAGSRNGSPTLTPEVIVVPRRYSSSPLAVSIRILRSPADLRSDHAPLIAVYVSTPEQRSTVSPEVIRRLLGVTRAEAELAARLALGDTIDVAARELGVTRATARTQLYSIFRKTGLRRQSELVSIITQTVARLPHC